MRISDWSSDVCSSDLTLWGVCSVARREKPSLKGEPRLSVQGAFSASSLARHYACTVVTCVRCAWAWRRPQGVTLSVSWGRSEEHTSELQSLMRISYAVFCLKKKKQIKQELKNLTRRT